MLFLNSCRTTELKKELRIKHFAKTGCYKAN